MKIELSVKELFLLIGNEKKEINSDIYSNKDTYDEIKEFFLYHNNIDRIKSETLCNFLSRIYPEKYSNYNGSGEKITPQSLAFLLRKDGVSPQQMKKDGEKIRGYKRIQFIKY